MSARKSSMSRAVTRTSSSCPLKGTLVVPMSEQPRHGMMKKWRPPRLTMPSIFLPVVRARAYSGSSWRTTRCTPLEKPVSRSLRRSCGTDSLMPCTYGPAALTVSRARMAKRSPLIRSVTRAPLTQPFSASKPSTCRWLATSAPCRAALLMTARVMRSELCMCDSHSTWAPVRRGRAVSSGARSRAVPGARKVRGGGCLERSVISRSRPAPHRE